MEGIRDSTLDNPGWWSKLRSSSYQVLSTLLFTRVNHRSSLRCEPVQDCQSGTKQGGGLFQRSTRTTPHAKCRRNSLGQSTLHLKLRLSAHGHRQRPTIGGGSPSRERQRLSLSSNLGGGASSNYLTCRNSVFQADGIGDFYFRNCSSSRIRSTCKIAGA